MGLLFKTVDEKLEEIGFKKIKEDKYGAEYERYNEQFKFTQKLDIMHKLSGNHIVQSYDVNSCTSKGCNMVGLTYKEMKLALAKMKELGYDKPKRK